MSFPLPSPVDGWQIDSTSRQVVLRLSTEGFSDFSIAARERGFLLEPDQARQIIRDLSAAVLASDVKRNAEFTDDQGQIRHEADQMLGELAALDSDSALRRGLKRNTSSD